MIRQGDTPGHCPWVPPLSAGPSHLWGTFLETFIAFIISKGDTPGHCPWVPPLSAGPSHFWGTSPSGNLMG